MHMPEPGLGAKDNGQLAAWLGLSSFTFFLGTFVAANVYLRGWKPEIFGKTLPSEIQNLSYLSVVVLLLAGILLLFAGVQFRNSQYKLFQASMAVGALLFAAYLMIQILLLKGYIAQGAAIATVNGAVTGVQILITLTCLALIGTVGWYGNSRDVKALSRLVPGAMAVWMYAVVVGLTVLIMTDVVSISEFADWCGTRVTQLIK